MLRFYRSGAFPVRSAWFADLDRSGGIVLDMMIHDLDIARWVAGEVTQVSATWSRRGDGNQLAEAGHVLLTHASGAITHVAGVSGAAHLPFTTGYFAAGTGGTLEYDRAAEQGFVADLARGPARGEAVPQTDPAEDPYFLVLADFLEAIRHGTPTRVTAADGAAAVRIATAALARALGPARDLWGAMKIGIMSFAHTHAAGYIRLLREDPDVELRAADPGPHPPGEVRGAERWPGSSTLPTATATTS